MAAATVTIANGASWQEVARDRQRHRDETIAAVKPDIPEIGEIPLNTISLGRQILTEEEIYITESVPEELLDQLTKGDLSAVQVANAFLRRAALAQKAACRTSSYFITNCITELLPERALSRAQFLDDYRKKNGMPFGPLHGIPISVKEHVGLKGLDHNAGFVAWVGRVSPEDAHIVQILVDAGAIIYARTTQPQTLMHLETSSNLYGVTVNPFNTTLTAGGSSGGEGALVGFRGSCLGIGTDIGGSIRSPAANNVGGWTATMAGAEHIIPTIGPLSTSLKGCKLFIKTLIDAKPWLKEPSLLPFPWKVEDAFPGKKLKVAILWDDGVVKPHPPVTRALKQVAEKLKDKSSIELVDWKPYKHDLAWDLAANLYFSDGAAQELEAIKESSEPMRPMSDHIITNNPHVQSHTIHSLWESHVRRDIYRTEYAKVWNETATSKGPHGEPQGMVDVILCPVGPGVAPKLDTSKWWGYTAQWNLLDYPALVFPVDQVDVEKDGAGEKYTPRNEKDKYNWDLWEQYGAEGYKDAPISLQLVGRRYEDEKVIQALEIIQDETGLPFVNCV
ncbi:hypothetical protein CJF30_00008553 [Rutstroemia sp. NJR-2017a BBW]|nr:hypothetical protein CJF30_00008553 [Rutstroemia sp. NJR-2017a BBW]